MSLEDDKQFCVKWGNHHGALFAVLESLLNDEIYVDCTLAAEGNEISAHKVILSACSPYLNKLLKKHTDKHPIILMKDISFFDLQCCIDYIYKGEVNVEHNQLSSFLKTAEALQITGLTGTYEKTCIKSKKMVDVIQDGEIIYSDNDDEDDADDDDDSEIGRIQTGINRKKKNSRGDEDTRDKVTAEILTDDEAKREIKLENIEYLTEPDESQNEFDVDKEDASSYQVYVVDDETGSLKAMTIDNYSMITEEKENDGNKIIKDFLQQVSLLDDEDSPKAPAAKKIKLVPDRCSLGGGPGVGTAASTVATTPTKIEGGDVLGKAKMRPKSVLHRDDYNISCNKCGGLYKHEATYLNHLRHDCNQSHVCIDCHKVFKNKRHLLDHIRDDCGRLHMCPNCKKYFKQKVNLTTHMKHYCKPEKVSKNYLTDLPDPLGSN